MSSELDLGTSDPTPGGTGGSPAEGQQQGTPAPQAPAGRSYSDADMANARRSFEADASRREQKLRQELEQTFSQRFVTREQPKPNDPWSKLDPQAATLMRELLDQELTPFREFQKQAQERQEDLALRNDEAEIRGKYKDYEQNRTDILNFAVQNGISNVETAYRAWKYDELSKVDPAAIGKSAIADYLKKKTAQASGTPAVEGRGGGAPSSKQAFKNREDMDDAAIAMIQAAQDQ